MLHPETVSTSIHSAVKHFIALPATDIRGAYLALYNRVRHFSKQAFEHYLYTSGMAGRLRGMRKQFFVIPRENFEILFTSTFNRREYAIKEDLKNSSVPESEIIKFSRRILNETVSRDRTRAQLIGSLSGEERKAIQLQSARQETMATLFDHTLDILLERWQIIPGRVTWKSKRNCYGTFSSRHYHSGFSLPYDQAEQQLVEMYIRNYGPVDDTDIAWWCGLTDSRVLEIIPELGEDVITVDISGKEFRIWESEYDDFFREIPQNTVCYLLGRNDPLLNGYVSGGGFVSGEILKKIQSPAGISIPTILLDGKIAGTWSSKVSKSSLKLSVSLFKHLNASEEDLMCKTIERIGDFLAGEDTKRNVELIYT